MKQARSLLGIYQRKIKETNWRDYKSLLLCSFIQLNCIYLTNTMQNTVWDHRENIKPCDHIDFQNENETRVIETRMFESDFLASLLHPSNSTPFASKSSEGICFGVVKLRHFDFVFTRDLGIPLLLPSFLKN